MNDTGTNCNILHEKIYIFQVLNVKRYLNYITLAVLLAPELFRVLQDELVRVNYVEIELHRLQYNFLN